MYRVILSAIHTPTQLPPNVQGSLCLQYTTQHSYSQMYRGHFVCNTQPNIVTLTGKCTGIILSAIHNPTQLQSNVQGSFCLQYTTQHSYSQMYRGQFVCNTHPNTVTARCTGVSLSAIHTPSQLQPNVQGLICLQYTTQYSYTYSQMYRGHFVCNTQPNIVTLTVKCTGVILSAIYNPTQLQPNVQGSFCLQYTPQQLQPNVQGLICLQYTPQHSYSQMYRGQFVCNTHPNTVTAKCTGVSL